MSVLVLLLGWLLTAPGAGVPGGAEVEKVVSPSMKGWPREATWVPHSREPALEPGQTTRDPWFASDKLRHFLTAFAVTGYGHAGLRALGADRDASLAGGIIVSIAAGVGKEIHDVRAGRFFSVRDLVWDLAGTLVGAGLVAAAR